MQTGKLEARLLLLNGLGKKEKEIVCGFFLPFSKAAPRS